MNIIGHTSHLNKNKDALQHFLISSSSDTVEMDFRLTQDGELVWHHNGVYNGNIISRSKYKDLKLLTLDDVLEILSGDIALLLHLKGVRGVNNKNIDKLLKALEILKDYPLYTELESISADFIRRILTYKDDLSYLDIGLIINLFTTFKYRKGNIGGLEKVDFISLSSELWEKGIVQDDYKCYRELFPNVREYAWTWEALYSENEERLKNYMAKGADGIITSDVALVRALNR